MAKGAGGLRVGGRAEVAGFTSSDRMRGVVVGRSRGMVTLRTDSGETVRAPRSTLQREGVNAAISASNRQLRRQMFASGATQAQVIAASQRNAQRISRTFR